MFLDATNDIKNIKNIHKYLNMVKIKDVQQMSMQG